MTGESNDPLKAFLEEARRRATAAGPLPEPVLNELKLLMLGQRRELAGTETLTSFTIVSAGLEWRTRWLLPVVLEQIGRSCSERSRYGTAVGRALTEAAHGLRSTEWNLIDAHSMTSSSIDNVHGFGIELLHLEVDEFALDRSGRMVCEALLAIATRIIDLSALGLELPAIAWARVLGVTDPMTNLVGLGLTQADAAASSRSANFPTPPADVALAVVSLQSPMFGDWTNERSSD